VSTEASSQSGLTHVWEKVEITLHAANAYENPYTDVEVWVDLQGPGFQRRVYGFWDGEDVFRVRVLATTPGEWRWTSGANVADSGLRDQSGAFRAIAWTEAEKQENPCRRGFLRPTGNGHAIEHADGTPCFLLGDTWWSTPTFRYRWDDDGIERPIGPEMGFKDMVRLRRSQGYNCIAMIAAFPNWANDGHPPHIELDDAEHTGIRSAWRQAGTQSAKDMHNEGGRPFLFPGRVPGYKDVYPDMDRINPAYFRYMDRKVDYLNAQGFIPFIEVARRDASQAWARFYNWPASYARYIQYVWTRYQANNCIFSPIHFDWAHLSIPSRAYNEPANAVVAKGIPAFDTLRSCNSAGSSLINFGNSDQNKWLTMHQIGNLRHHASHWLLTEIYHESQPTRPALNGEPYYAGWPPGTPILPGTEEADTYCRSGMYGSFLSGGLAGHIYGAEALWGGDIEPAAPYKMWDALQWRSGAQMQYLREFALSEGARYQELVPNAQLVYPNQTHEWEGNRGWAYCARTPDKSLFMVYFEADCPQSIVRGTLYERTYHAQWFNPRNGEWTDIGPLTASHQCEIKLPLQPTSEDWALKLTLVP
jgi:hypothetical protein